MSNSNNQNQPINYSASHDQANLQEELASYYEKLNEIKTELEEIQKDPQSLSEIQPKLINLLTHARQVFNDIQECAKKLSAIHLPTPDEKLKYAKSLVTHEPLTANEKYRFKKIEEALSLTNIIKSAGDETIKFQLGILGYAKDNKMITESEFNYLVVPRLKNNNLLDFYRVRAEGKMLLKQTPLEICQALDKKLSSDDDYIKSKILFLARIEGIDCELSLKRLKNLENNGSDIDLTKLRQELMSVPSQNDDSSEEDIPEEELPLPEVPTHPFELNSQQASNEPTINIYPIEEYQKKTESEFVSLIQELIPEKKKNEIHIDEISPISVEKIMQMTLHRSSPLSDAEKRNHNHSFIMRADKITAKAFAKVMENIEKLRTSIDGTYIFEEMIESISVLKDEHDKLFPETGPCKLTGKTLVEKYYKFGEAYLNKKIQKYETEIKNLKDCKKDKYGEFSKHNPKYINLQKKERKQALNSIYEQKKTTFNRALENARKQLALWSGNKTFTQNVEKNGKIKQKTLPFPEEKLHFRNLALNSASDGKTINVYSNGLYLVSNKKTENEQSSIQISNNQTSHKSFIPGQIINFYANHGQANLQEELASNFQKLNEIETELEEIQEDPHSSSEIQPELTNWLTHARQVFNDMLESAKKLRTIHLPTPEKLKYAKSLVTTPKPLTANEKYRFKEIEEALSLTSIIDFAGYEIIKFQLGILGDAKDSNMITDSEFNYFVVPRLKDNNLLDSYRVRAEGKMLLKQTPLEICQALDKDLSSDTDYEDSKKLFTARLKGIDCELSLKRLKNLENNGSDIDLTKLRQELMSVPSQNDDSSEEDIPEEELSLPEVPTHPFELNSQQASNEPTINIYPIEEYQKKTESEFVSLIQELIPEKKKNEIHIDEIIPISVEKIMRMTLQRPRSLLHTEKSNHNHSFIMRAKKITAKAVAEVTENIEKQRTSIDGTYIFKKMIKSIFVLKDEHDKLFKGTESCKLTGEPLVKEYYKFGETYLNKKIQKYETEIKNLKDCKKDNYGEFDKDKPQYYGLNDLEIKKKCDEIYRTKKEALNKDLEKTKKQKALWSGNKTFTQNVEKNGKIKQKTLPLPEEELHFRNLVLDSNSNSASTVNTINVYRDGVYIVSNKKAEPSQIPQISNIRASHKSIMWQTSSFFSMPNTKEENHKLAVSMPLKS